MSFLDNLVSTGADIWDWAKGSSNSAALTKTAAIGFALNQFSNMYNKDNNKTSNTNPSANKLQVNASTQNSIPVLYGDVYCGGVLTDAVLTNNNMTMWYCLTICEKTGGLMSTSNGVTVNDSVISFVDIYIDQLKLVLQSDGITAAKLVDEDGHESTDINGLVKVYLFNNGSSSPVKLNGYGNGNSTAAYSLFPNWSSSHTMNNLVFALIKVTYNADKNITSLGDVTFRMNNTLKMPGDVLFDYMTNTRYGAGIDPTEIYDA